MIASVAANRASSERQGPLGSGNHSLLEAHDLSLKRVIAAEFARRARAPPCCARLQCIEVSTALAEPNIAVEHEGQSLPRRVRRRIEHVEVKVRCGGIA